MSAASPLPIALVIPCYNEAQRLDDAAFAAAAERYPQLHQRFVDDGSTDETAARLEALCAKLPRASLLRLAENSGKAEAVRQGMLACLDEGDAALVGFWDADLATPFSELEGLANVFEADEIEVALGSRVALLGRRIQRRPWRHYIGRCFATAASMVLELPVYDTQCGAKLFRAGPLLRTLIGEPFRSSWLFDVELLARYIRTLGAAEMQRRIVEVPLRSWYEIAGSKVRPHDALVALYDLARIRRGLRR